MLFSGSMLSLSCQSKYSQLKISQSRGWSDGAMVLGKLPVPGRPTIWMKVGQGPLGLAVGSSGGLFGHFYSPILPVFFLPLSGRRAGPRSPIGRAPDS